MRKNERGRLLERVSDALEIPGEALAYMPGLTMTGNKRVHIEGHKGILQYDSDTIAVNGGVLIFKIYGDKLEIASMNAEEILITGSISKFEFEDMP